MESRTGIFYEIGGNGAISSYLAEPGWSERDHGVFDHTPPLLPSRYAEYYDNWIVYIVEPAPTNMVNVAHVAAGNPNIHMVQCAVGPENKYLMPLRVVDMATNPDWGTDAHGYSSQIEGVNLLGPDEEHISFTEHVYTTYVQLLTLDSLFEIMARVPDVLRIDIEGAEVETLAAYSFDPAPRMIQVDHHTINLSAIEAILLEKGYRILEWTANTGGDAGDIIAERIDEV